MAALPVAWKRSLVRKFGVNASVAITQHPQSKPEIASTSSAKRGKRLSSPPDGNSKSSPKTLWKTVSCRAQPSPETASSSALEPTYTELKINHRYYNYVDK